MSTKPWITTEIFTHADQKVFIQPTPEFDGIELHITELDGSTSSGALYIVKEELPVIIEKLNQMMDYITNK